MLLRDAVEGNDDLVGRPWQGRHRLTNRLGERLDIGRMGVVRRDDPECRHEPQHRQLPEHLVVGRSRRRAGVLRVERKQQQPVRPPGDAAPARPTRSTDCRSACPATTLNRSGSWRLSSASSARACASRDDEQRRAVGRSRSADRARPTGAACAAARATSGRTTRAPGCARPRAGRSETAAGIDEAPPGSAHPACRAARASTPIRRSVSCASSASTPAVPATNRDNPVDLSYHSRRVFAVSHRLRTKESDRPIFSNAR